MDIDKASYLDQEKYRNEFNPKAYLNSMFCNAEVFTSEMQLLVDFYRQFPNDKVQNREAFMRKKVEAVVHCDLAADPIIAKGYEGPYDVVNCNVQLRMCL